MVAETTNAPALRPRRWLRRSKWMRVRATDDANTSRWQSKPALSDDLAKSRPDDNIELSRWPLHWMDRRRFWARSTSRSPSVAWWSTRATSRWVMAMESWRSSPRSAPPNSRQHAGRGRRSRDPPLHCSRTLGRHLQCRTCACVSFATGPSWSTSTASAGPRRTSVSRRQLSAAPSAASRRKSASRCSGATTGARAWRGRCRWSATAA